MKTTGFKLDVTLKPLEQEIYIVEWFLGHWSDNPKKIVKLAKELDPLIPHHFRISITRMIIGAKNPVSMVKELWHELHEWRDMYAQMLADGYHGVMSYQKQVWGVKIEVFNPNWLKPEHGLWAPDIEDEIVVDLIDRWKIKHKKKQFLGKLILFPECGFSGESKSVEHVFPDEFFNAVTKEGISQEEVNRLLRTVKIITSQSV